MTLRPIHESSTRGAIGMSALLIVAVIHLLACSTSATPSSQNEFKLGFQAGPESAQDASNPGGEHVQHTSKAQEDGATTSPEQPDAASRSANAASDAHALGDVQAPSRAHLEYAQKQGLPLPTPMQRTAGPFEGPERSLLYIDHEGHVTLYIPGFHTVYFAQLEANQLKWLYGASLQGYFMFDQSNDYVGLSEPPEKLVSWPMAVESAQQVAAFARLYLDAHAQHEQTGAPLNANVASHRDLDALSPGERATFWSSMQAMSDALAALPTQRVASIGGKGCVAHYPYSYYIGCY